jgi:DNA-directed RNA polymerase specialized sigma24 family protein
MGETPLHSFHGCARGESESWDDLVRELGPFLSRLVRRELALRGRGGSGEFEDLVQDAWCRLLADGRRRMRAFRGATGGELAVYLAALARSVVSDHLRATASAKRGGGLAPLRITGEGGSEVIPVRDPTPSAEHRLLARERRSEARERLRELAGPRATPRRLRLLELALVHDLPSAEISRRIAPELAPSSIDSIVCRFRRRVAARGIGVPSRRRGRRPRNGG